MNFNLIWNENNCGISVKIKTYADNYSVTFYYYLVGKDTCILLHYLHLNVNTASKTLSLIVVIEQVQVKMCKIIFRPTIINGPYARTHLCMYVCILVHVQFLVQPLFGYNNFVRVCMYANMFYGTTCISPSHRFIIRSLYYNYVTKSTFSKTHICCCGS